MIEVTNCYFARLDYVEIASRKLAPIIGAAFELSRDQWKDN